MSLNFFKIIKIIINALHSLPDRSAAVRVQATYDPMKNRIIVKVQDEGSGIDEEQLQDLTKPFFTTKTASGGVGLGLSISASILERHKGAMRFNSEPGRGTTVTIKLPVDTAH